MTVRLDKTKPYILRVDFRHQTRIFEQGGKTFTEGGVEVVDEVKTPFKFGCPRCEYGADDKMAMFHHLRDIHRATPEFQLKFQKEMDKIEPPPVPKEDPATKTHCKHCPSKFKTRQALASHMKKHSGKAKEA